MPARMKIKGLKSAHKKLAAMGGKIGKPIARKAVRSGTAIIAKGVRAECPRDENILAKSVAYKVTNRGFKFKGIVGSDIAKLQAANGADKNYPTNIDHLVEFGHVAPNGTVIPPSGFMRRGFATSQGRAEAKTAHLIKEGLAQAARKGSK